MRHGAKVKRCKIEGLIVKGGVCCRHSRHNGSIEV